MLYNNVISIVRLRLLLLLGVSGCFQVPMRRVVHDSPTVKVDLTVVSFQARVVCSQGNKCVFLIEANISDTKSKGHVGIVGLPAGVQLDHSLLKQAMESKNQAEQLLWKNKSFIYWQQGYSNGDGKFLFTIDQNDVNKCVASSYNIYMIYVEEGSDRLVHSPSYCLMDISQFDSSSSSNYDESMKLTIKEPDSKINEDNPATWNLKGSVAGKLNEGEQVGFILTKPNLDPCTCVSKVIASDRGWPEKIAFLDDCIVVPGTYETNSKDINGVLEGDKLPIEAQVFHIYCYLKRGSQYYLTDAYQSIDLKGKPYDLQSLAIEVTCAEALGNITAVNLQGNRQLVTIPGEMEACVLFFKKGTIWRTHEIKALYKQMQEKKVRAAMTKDQRLCLVANEVEILDSTCLSFFARNFHYAYFTCLLARSDGMVKCYSKQLELSLRFVSAQNQSANASQNQTGNASENQTENQTEPPVNNQSVSSNHADLTIGPAKLSLSIRDKFITKVDLCAPTVSSGASGFIYHGFLLANKPAEQLSDQHVREMLNLSMVNVVSSPVVHNQDQRERVIMYKVGDTINEQIKNMESLEFYSEDKPVHWSIVYWQQLNDSYIRFSKPAEVKIEVEPEEPPAAGVSDVAVSPSPVEDNTRKVPNKENSGFFDRFFKRSGS